MRFRRSALFAVLAGGFAVAGLAVAPPAPAAPRVVTSTGFSFTPSTVEVLAGDTLTYANAHSAPHNVVAVAKDAANRPLFASTVATTGRTAEVVGVASLDAGSYAFLCTIHPAMKGTLVVADSPLPVPAARVAPAAAAAGVTLVASGGVVPTPTSVAVHDGSVYASSYADGSVYAMPILAGGLLGPATPYATGFTSPLGITFGPDGTLFVADSHPADPQSGRGVAGRVWAIPTGGGTAGTVGQVVIDDLPNGRHNTNGMAVKDGRLYIANGNSTDDGLNGGEPETPISGALLSVDVAARGLTAADSGSYVVEATGMRNNYDVVFRPGTTEAWMPVNGPDTFDPWGEDWLAKVDVAGGSADMGFPGCLFRRGDDGVSILTTDNPVAGPCSATHTPPAELLGLHTSADGADFGPDGGFWDGDLFVAMFGNFFGSEVVGHRVVRVPIDEQGNAGPYEDLTFGGAPLDVAFGPDGLYVADFGSSQISLVKAVEL